MPDPTLHEPPLPRTWSESDRLVPRAVVRPLRRFASTEAAGGVVMLAMAIAALAWANSPAGESYTEVWGTALTVHLGDLAHIDLSLRGWINDLAMAFFFFVVALEIKRELVRGELRDPRAAALPAIAALGGMVVPAAIYALFNSGGAGADGWGIPMATDIAFAIGVLSLVGRRVPSSLIIFLLTLAIVDDLGAIVVIAVFYTSDMSLGWLALGVASIVVALGLKRVDVRSLVPYALLAAFCWFALHESGVHATLAGVAFGLLTPSLPFIERPLFGLQARALVDRAEEMIEAEDLSSGEDEHGEEADALNQLIVLAEETQPPLDRLEHRLVPWTTFAIVPVFALANAGVQLSWDDLVGAFTEPVTLGVMLGLVLGKAVGIFTFALVAIRLGIGKHPVGASWPQLFGVAMLGGIGFTVALFVTELAFEPGAVADQAKVGILAASAIAGIAGYTFLRVVGRAHDHDHHTHS
ncbi:Na+/H+ antiporter NhaA [Actinomarinicola tropica]|uniref:Na+/H+ antiporter NhaA n=1 Tax=Actinomarinicola tropica TaxID=2789776 RepID=UPI00189BE175|nr:Na+/H+ antiporter NhaA [Actinomarinicola tropica]